MNSVWKSKTKLVKLCKAFGGTLSTTRVTDKAGNRVFPMQYRNEVIGFITLRDAYAWCLLQSRRGKPIRKV